jgi:NAD(P)-dependent dehydrogenase (short-subunit alcohol dehydrogenase family)
MKSFQGRTAVITGAGSGFGLEVSRLAAQRGMKLAMVDVQKDALDRAAAEMQALGAEVLAVQVDVAKADAMEALGAAVAQRFGAPHFVFNNAGIGAGGLIWENTVKDWEWVLGVNVMGVAHGVRVFTPIMLRQNERAHIVNTASVAGLISPPAMGVYNASKHAVVALTETLYHDLRRTGAPIGCSLLCPAFAPTGIAEAERARPARWRNEAPPSASQVLAGRELRKAVRSGRLSAADIAAATFDAVHAGRFYVITHPAILPSVRVRHEDIEQMRAPSDPSLPPGSA